MKHVSALFRAALPLLLCLGLRAQAEDLSLCESDGQAVAFLADDLTLHLWSGEAVAYVEAGFAPERNVYSLNGEHLGWYASGVVWDHQGRQVVASAAALLPLMVSEPARSDRRAASRRDFRATPPQRPVFSRDWSTLRLGEFFRTEGGC